MVDRMNQGERHHLEAGPKKTPLAKWLLTQFKGTTLTSSCNLPEPLPRSVGGCEHQVTTTGYPAGGIMEDDGIGEKPWQLPESSSKRSRSYHMEIVKTIGRTQFALASASHQKWKRKRSDSGNGPRPLGLDPRVSPGFLSATNNGHLSAISIHLIYPSITSVRVSHLLYPIRAETRHRP